MVVGLGRDDDVEKFRTRTQMGRSEREEGTEKCENSLFKCCRDAEFRSL